MARQRHVAATVGTVAVLLSGCTTLPEPDPSRGDCQLRAGAAILEGSSQWVSQGGAYGGAVTKIGDCGDNLHIITRTANGSLVVHSSDPEVVRAAMDSQPLEVTPAQLREIANGGNDDSPLE